LNHRNSHRKKPEEIETIDRKKGALKLNSLCFEADQGERRYGTPLAYDRGAKA
jgi:hypothetical protein